MDNIDFLIVQDVDIEMLDLKKIYKVFYVDLVY